jgi:NADP-dependent 3-hydroxy acid dehydrogenase YdfG
MPREPSRRRGDGFGRVGTIFLNAGLMPNAPLSALKTADWHQMVGVNIKGVLNGVVVNHGSIQLNRSWIWPM